VPETPDASLNDLEAWRLLAGGVMSHDRQRQGRLCAILRQGPAKKQPPRLKITLLGAAVLVVLTGTAASPAPIEPRRLFAFADQRITESSGLAVSARHNGVIYTHNDSGGEPALYAIGPDGRTRAVLTLRGAAARDWEALAPGRDGTLWVGDIGDNGPWWDEIRVYRVREPSTLRSADVAWTRYRLRYEDGRHNAEALLVDPRTGQLFVVSKQRSGAGVYAAPRKLRTDVVNVLRRVADAPRTVTDGAFLPDGQRVVLRGYDSATVLDRGWRRLSTFAVPLQRQGESLAVVPDGAAVLVGSEGTGADVWQVPLSAGSDGPAPSAAAAPQAVPEAAPPAARGLPGHTKAVIGVLTAVFVLALAGTLIPKRR